MKRIARVLLVLLTFVAFSQIALATESTPVNTSKAAHWNTTKQNKQTTTKAKKHHRRHKHSTKAQPAPAPAPK